MSHREDLLAEATALVERVEFTVPEFSVAVVAGFRRDSSLSIYFGGDPVYHFNSRGQLRRAFVAERLFKADHGNLAALTRQREGTQTVLVRHDLTPDETTEFLTDLQSRIGSLHTAIENKDFQLRGQVAPADRAHENVVERLGQWLSRVPTPVVIAANARSV